MASILKPASSPMSRVLGLALLFSAATAQNSGGCDINNLTTSYPAPVAADGWAYRLVASNITSPRGILFDTEGALLVVERGTGIVRFSFDDEEGTCLRVRNRLTVVENDELNHGIALSEDGRTLYASSRDDVYSWTYYAGNASVNADSRRTLVTKMGGPSGHSTRTLLLSRKNPDMLLVSVGSGPNEDPKALDRSTGISQIRAFNVSALGEKDDAYDYTDGTVLGWGLRNSVGVGEHPGTGGIWSVENSVDNLSRQGRDIHDENPAEELNFHGYLNGSRENQGGNYGYPLCYTLWDTGDFPERGSLKVGDQFTIDWEGGGNVSIPTDRECNTDYVPPILPFEAHMAPLDIKFNGTGTEAFVSFHGSWNREDPAGYKVSRIDFSNDTGRPRASSDDKGAAVTILSNENLGNCPNDCFRPVGLALDSKGRLWFSSDSTGEIFVLGQDGSSGGGNQGGGGGGGGGNGSGEGEGDGDGGDSAASGYVRPGLATFALIVAFAMSLA